MWCLLVPLQTSCCYRGLEERKIVGVHWSIPSNFTSAWTVPWKIATFLSCQKIIRFKYCELILMSARLSNTTTAATGGWREKWWIAGRWPRGQQTFMLQADKTTSPQNSDTARSMALFSQTRRRNPLAYLRVIQRSFYRWQLCFHACGNPLGYFTTWTSKAYAKCHASSEGL